MHVDLTTAETEAVRMWFNAACKLYGCDIPAPRGAPQTVSLAANEAIMNKIIAAERKQQELIIKSNQALIELGKKAEISPVPSVVPTVVTDDPQPKSTAAKSNGQAASEGQRA